MFKFKVKVKTPYGEYNREYFAISRQRAEKAAERFNEDFSSTDDYSVKLLSVEPTTEPLPESCVLW